MRKLFLIIPLLFSSPALAEKPTEISSYIKAEQPHGEGSLSRLWITGYDAELWTDADGWSMKAPFALSLVYRMEFTTDELVERTIKEMKRIPGIEASDLKDYPAQLRTWFPTVHDGDRITAAYVPHKGTYFYYNHVLTGKSTDEIFAQRFFAIWLGPHTSEPKLRQALLN